MRKMIYVTFIYFFQFLSLSFSFLLDPFPHLTLLGSAPRVSRPGDESRSPSWRRRVPRPTLGPWVEGGQRLAPTADARRRECIHGCGSPRPLLAAGEVAHPAPDARPLGGGQAAARPHGRRSSPGRHPCGGGSAPNAHPLGGRMAGGSPPHILFLRIVDYSWFCVQLRRTTADLSALSYMGADVFILKISSPSCCLPVSIV
ncbi:hypothetical protein PAHAL_2G049200 [Panicum hallii]|jgi:hypothetical protein|uniref:Uncharacterized protein n=1 Tax=Panicum hallii TaxID=206008 RepID=A0A2S3GW99_9POAL|nr:hypothetical protein PAHAL_2G049200 [Panicum hallii]